MTNFEFKALQLMAMIEAHFAALVGVKASAAGAAPPEPESMRTCRDDAHAANIWLQLSETYRNMRGSAPYLARTYEDWHKEAARRFESGFSSGGDFEFRSAAAEIVRAAQLSRKCECGWADRCGYPSDQCPVERSGVYEVPSKVAHRLMVPIIPPDLTVKPYDIISTGPGIRAVARDEARKRAVRGSQVCGDCGHTKREHAPAGIDRTACGRCPCIEFKDSPEMRPAELAGKLTDKCDCGHIRGLHTLAAGGGCIAPIDAHHPEDLGIRVCPCSAFKLVSRGGTF